MPASFGHMCGYNSQFYGYMLSTVYCHDMYASHLKKLKCQIKFPVGTAAAVVVLVMPPPKMPAEAGEAVVVVAAPPKERADPKDCPKPDLKPEELAGTAAAVVGAAAGAAPKAVELAAVVAAAEPKEGVADPKGLEAAEAVVAKTEEPRSCRFTIHSHNVSQYSDCRPT